MANTGKLKPKADRFGDLSPKEDRTNVLEAPEHAPAEPKKRTRAKKDAPTRKTSWGSTVQADFPQRIKMAAVKRGCSVVELLESWLEAEEKKN